MSTARVTAKLGRVGYDLDRLEELDRGELLEALAEAMLVEPAPESATDFGREAREASQVPLPAEDSSSATSDGRSAALRLRELEERRAEKEERKTAREAEERKAAREAEAQRLALKAEERRAVREAEREQREAERAQRAMEAEERRRKLEITVAREQAELYSLGVARLKAEQVKLDHEIRLEELKAH